MSGKFSLKTVLIYTCAIIFGAVLGAAINRLVGDSRIFANQSAVVQAAAPAVAADFSPNSAATTYICTPSYIGAFPNRVHVLCTVTAPGGINYFAAPTSDSKNAARILSIMLTAKSLGKNLQIYYDTAGDGSAYNCQMNDCRPINAIEMTN